MRIGLVAGTAVRSLCPKVRAWRNYAPFGTFTRVKRLLVLSTIFALCAAATLAAAEIHTIAGTGVKGFSGDGGPAAKAQVNNPYGLTRGPDGALYFCDTDNQRVRKIAPDGTISTATFDNEAFYYISQTRKRYVAFDKPRLIDQHVLAVYFGADGRVTQIANYGLKDGKVFDFISRTTPTGGKDQNFLSQIINGASKLAPGIPGGGTP